MHVVFPTCKRTSIPTTTWVGIDWKQHDIESFTLGCKHLNMKSFPFLAFVFPFDYGFVLTRKKLHGERQLHIVKIRPETPIEKPG